MDLPTLPEVAELLRVSHQTIYNMVRDGCLQAQKAGREWRFRREDMDKILAPQVALAARADKPTHRDLQLHKNVWPKPKRKNMCPETMTPEFAARELFYTPYIDSIPTPFQELTESIFPLPSIESWLVLLSPVDEEYETWFEGDYRAARAQIIGV